MRQWFQNVNISITLFSCEIVYALSLEILDISKFTIKFIIIDFEVWESYPMLAN